jgi:glycosyltransferase involved in cell wall biosynthesis
MSGAGHRPLVSIIMIFLNAELFIEEAIASVREQTYDHWELILVDDGSSDASTRIAREFQARDRDRIRYVEHPGHVNRGMSASRNRGLAVASGELIAFLDADDVYLPERLERHVQALERYPEVQAVQSRCVLWHSWRGTRAYTPPDAYERALPLPINVPISPPGLLYLMLESDGSTAPIPCSMTLRRATLEAVGGSEDSFRGLYEDLVMYAKVYLTAPVLVLNDCLARYRLHPASITHLSKRQRSDGARLAFLTWLACYLRAHEINEPLVWESWRQAMWQFQHPAWWQIRELPSQAVRAAIPFVKRVLSAPVADGMTRWWGERKRAAAVAKAKRAWERMAGRSRRLQMKL